MKFRRLGRTDLQVSSIGVGTWQFGGEWGRPYSQAEVDSILDQAAECDINLIDTAECYGDHLSESLIGDYLSRRLAERWIVATKFGHRYLGFMNRSWHLAVEEVRTQLDASLKALKRDTIDLYQFHSGTDDAFQNADLWAMLEQQKQAGKIRHLGVSISSGTQHDLQARLARSYGIDALQVYYNRLERKAENLFFPAAQRDDLGILARVPLASGYLTGKFTADTKFPESDVRATFDRDKVRGWLDAIEEIKRQELPAGIPLAKWALAWCLINPLVSCVIPGCKDPAQVRFNAAAADLL